MSAWAIQLRTGEIDPLGVLWRIPGVEAMQDGGQIWLRGHSADDTTRRILGSISCAGSYEVLADGALRQIGRLVPHGYLPAGTWRPLDVFLTIALPPSIWPARQLPRVPVRLVPSTTSLEPNILLTNLECWRNYAATAPQVRLRQCQFAVADDGRVLVQGTPLPSISGVRAVARHGVVVPCGWTWAPAVDASILAKSWGINPGDLWLLWPGRPVERIGEECLVAANRSAVRRTWEAFQRA